MLRKLRALSPRGKTIASLCIAGCVTACITVIAYAFQMNTAQSQTASAAFDTSEIQAMQKTLGELTGSFKEQWGTMVNTTASYVQQIQTEAEQQPQK